MKTKLSAFPEWHEKPLKLTIDEIEYPESVISDFFDLYGLLDVRLRLNEWRGFCIACDSENAHSLLCLFDRIHQLVEASWLKNNKLSTRQNKQYSKEDISMGFNIDWSIRLIDQIPERPLSCLYQVFDAFHPRQYVEVFEKWKNIALSSEWDHYREAEERKKLISLCIKMPYLFEAMLIIKKRSRQQSANLSPERETNFVYLNRNEQEQPISAIRSFFSEFDIQYIRKELWEMLGPVLNAEPLIKNTPRTLSIYEHLECSFEIAYHFLKIENEINSHTIEMEVLYENMKLQCPRLISTENSTFPAWQNSPMHLDIHEIENPDFILIYLFKYKSLPEIREIFQKCIANLSSENIIPHEDHQFYHQIEKLIEAAWVINERNNDKTKNR